MKLNGIEIKSLKVFKGHEGESLVQGNVFLNGKKLGFWSQDSWGGCDRYEFDEEVLKEASEAYQASLPEDFRYREYANSPDVVLGVIANMKDAEQHFKRAVKQGYKAMVFVTDGFHLGYLYAPEDTDVLKKYEEDIQAIRNDMFENEKIVTAVFTSLNDFDITADKDNPAPDFLYHE